MKRIGIAVFSLMFMGISYVVAQDVQCDFDDKIDIQNVKKAEGFTMPEAISDIEYDIPVPKREVNYEFKENNTHLTYKGLTKEMLDNSIKSAIEHSKKNKLNTLKSNFQKLLKNGTIEEKYNFVYSNKKSYDFPERIVEFTEVENTFNQTKGATRICTGWDTKEVCVDKKTWAKVCTAATLSCVVITAGGAPVCTTIAAACSFVAVWTPECMDVPYCIEWDTVIY